MFDIPGPNEGMIGAFTFDDKHTSYFKCVSRSISRPILPAARVKRVEVQAISGVQDFDDVEYDLKTLSFRIMYIGEDFKELRSKGREIAAWLATPNWAKLILDDEPDIYHWAKVTGETDLNHFFRSGAIDVNFECQPFALGQDVTVALTTEEPKPIPYEGTRHLDNRSPQLSKFLLRADVNVGASNFRIGDRTLIFHRPENASASSLVIDTIKMVVTLGGQNAFQHLRGDLRALSRFFRLNPGDNTYSIWNNVNSASVEFSPLYY